MMADRYTRDNLAEVLRAHDINPTHQRIEIAYALFSRGEHLSADQLLAIVNGRHSETSKATVYNTLNLFVAKGLLRELVLAPGRVVFDPKIEPHHHFIEDATGHIHDVPWNALQVSRVDSLEGFSVREYQVVMRGSATAERVKN